MLTRTCRPESEEESEVEEGGEVDDDQDEPEDTSGLETPMDDGMASVASGIETPQAIDLRKGSR